jgi:hypothetical protein
MLAVNLKFFQNGVLVDRSSLWSASVYDFVAPASSSRQRHAIAQSR